MIIRNLESHEVELSNKELSIAYLKAQELLSKHTYWMALYHCMTLLIWCKRNHIPYWTEEELRDIKFWWTVRDYVYKSKG